MARSVSQSVCSQNQRAALHNPSSHLRPAPTCCPTAFTQSEYEDVGQQGRGASQPAPSSPSVRKDWKAPWALINANYARAVINLGTLVLADENKTITFSPCWCQQLSLGAAVGNCVGEATG